MADPTVNDTVLAQKKTPSSELKRRVEILEEENRALINENGQVKSQLSSLTAEIESLTSNASDTLEEEIYVDACEEVEREIESIASRAIELETEAFNVHQDLIAVINKNEEINGEVQALKEEMREKEARFERVKKERAGVEMRVREMERKIGVLEVRESAERSKTVRLEEELRERIDVEERELRAWLTRTEELEKEAEVLRGSIESARATMDGKISFLQKEVKEKCLEAIKEISFGGAGCSSGELQSPPNVERPLVSLAAALASTGAATAAVVVAVMYFLYAKRR